MIIFAGSESISLTGKVAKKINVELGRIEIKRFPDNEFYVRVLSNIKGKNCVVIQSTPRHDNLIELFIILDALQDFEAKNTSVILPYLTYARQDKRFKNGEALSAKTILKILDSFSDLIVTINCHFFDKEGEFEYHGIKIRNLDAFPDLARYFGARLSNPVVIAPDKGSEKYAEKAAEILKCDFDYLSKKRISGTEVQIDIKKLDVKGKDVLILDDIISTGGTILEAAKIVRKQGARSVNVGCVHGIFSKGLKMFDGVVDELVCTDTIPKKVSKVSVSRLLADAIKKE